MEKYLLFIIVEREMPSPDVFDTWDEAFEAMIAELREVSKGDDVPENIKEILEKEEEYADGNMGIGRDFAWLNTRDNYDWQIRKLTVVGQTVTIE